MAEGTTSSWMTCSMCRESASRVELPGEKRRWGGAWAWALGTPHRTCNYRPYNSTVLLGSILYSGPKHATHTNLLSSLRLSLFSSHSFKPIGASMPLSRSIHDLFGSRISVQESQSQQRRRRTLLSRWLHFAMSGCKPAVAKAHRGPGT